MTLSAHQPAYIPWLGYFHKMAHCDRFVMLDDVQFETGSFINRNRIAVRSGSPWLTIPVKTKDHLNKTIRNTEIAGTSWPESHKRRIEAVYGGLYGPWGALWLLESANNCNDLIKATAGLTDVFAKCMEIDTPVEYQSHIGVKGNKLELIVNLCKHYGADAFLFGTEGYDEYGHDLDKYGIHALRQEYNPPDKWSVLHYLLTVGRDETRRLICG